MTQEPRGPLPRGLRREVVSFARRDGRVHPKIARAWRPRHEELLVHPQRGERDASLDPRWRFDPVMAFGRSAPLVVEIGSGVGEVVLASAAAHPQWDHLAVEVYRPGAAKTVLRADRAGLGNVRVLQADAAALLRTGLEPASVAEIRIFFPDPWPKARHHKRRLITPATLRDAAQVLSPGGVLRLATDWADYAASMLVAVESVPMLCNPYQGGPSGGYAPRWEGRPETHFERKGARQGRTAFDIQAVRRRQIAPSDPPESRISLQE